MMKSTSIGTFDGIGSSSHPHQVVDDEWGYVEDLNENFLT